MSSAIRDTSETLLELLRTELAAIVQPQQIALLSPAEAGLAGGVRLTLFLYAAAPAAELRNEHEIPGARGNNAPVSEPQFLSCPCFSRDHHCDVAVSNEPEFPNLFEKRWTVTHDSKPLHGQFLLKEGVRITQTSKVISQ